MTKGKIESLLYLLVQYQYRFLFLLKPTIENI